MNRINYSRIRPQHIYYIEKLRKNVEPSLEARARIVVTYFRSEEKTVFSLMEQLPYKKDLIKYCLDKYGLVYTIKKCPAEKISLDAYEPSGHIVSIATKLTGLGKSTIYKHWKNHKLQIEKIKPKGNTTGFNKQDTEWLTKVNKKCKGSLEKMLKKLPFTRNTIIKKCIKLDLPLYSKTKVYN